MTLPLAYAAEVRQRIERNIQIGQDNLAFAEPDPLYASLKAIQDSQLHPRRKLSRVRLEIIPALESLKKKHGISPLVRQVSDTIP
jgi:hypothetical protein